MAERMTPEFAQIWYMLGMAYPNFAKESGAEQMAQTGALYWELLHDLPLDNLKAAVLRHTSASKWFPTIAELREAAAALVQLPQRSGLDAWGDVVNAMADTRYYTGYTDGCHEYPVFDDPITQSLVKSLGWVDLCRSENPIADRARFIDAYNVRANAARGEVSLPTLLRAGAQRQAALGTVEPQKVLPQNGTHGNGNGLTPVGQIIGFPTHKVSK